MTTETIEGPAPTALLDRNDPDYDELAHVVLGGPEVVRMAIRTGRKVRALCGKEWVPTIEPEGMAVCVVCASLAGLDQT